MVPDPIERKNLDRKLFQLISLMTYARLKIFALLAAAGILAGCSDTPKNMGAAVDNDKNPRHYLGKFYLDSLVHDADALRSLIRLVGVERIALGSDYPFPLGEHEPGKLIESLTDLPAESRARMLGGTALELGGIEAAQRGKSS